MFRDPIFRRLRTATLVLLLLALAPWGASSQAAETDLLLILDASGSMWGQIQGENKIVIARRVLQELIGELPAGAEVGLVAYGHRREGDCEDVETIVPLGPLDKAALNGQIEALNPKGKTPITTSVRQAIDIARGRDQATTVLLVSDGLETCGGDPCATVREAKAAGVKFILHVVGFDVSKEDVSQLECAAQAGGGLYLDARNADELSAALDQAVAVPADLPTGRLSVKAMANGELVDAMVKVTRASDGEDVGGGRTYTGAETNPRTLPLPDGTYNVAVKAVRIKGSSLQRFEDVVIKEGEAVEKVADFSTGELAVGVTRNGARSDATVGIYVAGTRQQAGGGRTYTGEKSNPKVTILTAGTYDVVIKSVEMDDGLAHRFETVTVEGNSRVDLSHDFVSGTLRVGAVKDGALVDATVGVVRDGKGVTGGRTYTGEKSNPRTFILSPGTYQVKVAGVRVEGKPKREFEVTVEAGGTTEKIVDFSGGS